MRACVMVEPQMGMTYDELLHVAKLGLDSGLEGIFRSDHYDRAGNGKPVLDAKGQPVYAPPKEQRAEADVNIEFQATSRHADAAAKLAWHFRAANDRYATHYPAAVGFHMTNTDSTPFMDLVPAISLRENERGMHTGAGWNPTWHQPIDVFATFSDKDFRLGLNAAQTTLSAVAQLTGAKTK